MVLKMIAAVLFDLDETILDRRKSLEEFLSWQFDRHYSKYENKRLQWIGRFLNMLAHSWK